MRVAVLGAGITGLATAWYLLEDGHEVTVVDKNVGPGLGTSYANGAQLSYSYVAPLAGPGVLPKIPPWLLRRDSPLRFYPALDAHQWRWLLEFVLRVQPGAKRRDDATAAAAVVLQPRVDARVRGERAGAAIDFGYARNGKLVVYSDADGFESAKRLVDYQRSLGCEQDALDADAVPRRSSLRLPIRPPSSRDVSSAASTRRARRSATAMRSASASSALMTRTRRDVHLRHASRASARVGRRRAHDRRARDAARPGRGGSLRARVRRSESVPGARAGPSTCRSTR